MGETLNGVSGLDIDSEKKLAQQTLSSLNAKDLPEREIRQRMKILGSQRYKSFESKTTCKLHYNITIKYHLLHTSN